MKVIFPYNRSIARLLIVTIVLSMAWPVVGVWAQEEDPEAALKDEQRSVVGPSALPPFPVAEPIDPTKYICGVGDQFVISMWGTKEAEIFIVIGLEGDLIIPGVGKLYNLPGKSLAQVKQMVRQKVGSMYSNIPFDVNLASPRSFLVYVGGYANRPGIYPANPFVRISDFAKRCGGPTFLGSSRFIEIWRQEQLYQTVDLLWIERKGLEGLENNITLLDGDVIKFPKRGRRVAIYGAIWNPGSYELSDTETLPSLVDFQAEGLAPSAAVDGDITIMSRGNTDRYRSNIFTFEILKNENFPLQDGDRLYIPHASLTGTGSGGYGGGIIRVQGAVNGIGGRKFSHEQSNIVAEIGGVETTAGETTTGSATEAAVPSAETPGASSIDGTWVAVDTALKGVATEYFGIMPYVEGETVFHAIERAGGVTPYADTDNAFVRRRIPDSEQEYEILPVNLTKMIIDGDFSGDFDLVPGDFLVVPSFENTIFIYGEVLRPGQMQYLPYYSAQHYVGLAGGPTSRAAYPRSVVIHSNGETEKLDINAIPQPGDSIFIKEKTFKFWQDHWEILTGTASLVISGLALFLTLEAYRDQ